MMLKFSCTNALLAYSSSFTVDVLHTFSEENLDFYLEEAVDAPFYITLYPRMKMHAIGPFLLFLDLIQPAVLCSLFPFLVEKYPC